MPRLQSRHEGGFTLLEAIVALVVFSLGAFALYGWLATNTIAMQRVSERREVAQMRGSAIDLMRLVNPMAQASGRRSIDGLQVQWQARLLEPARAGATQVGLPTLFEIGLYQVDVRVLRDQRVVDQFTMRQLGYRQVRTLEPD